MTRPISPRVRPSLVAAMDARAARFGQTRSRYLLSLVEQDLAAEPSPLQHRFASEDLIGSLRTGLKFGDNATIRRLARERLCDKHR